ncbi:MAG: iron-containing redox enzyme family protein [Rhodospirillales bacterium]|nr:iron-containing redox enzyme family protein [Rhodospirillales bacterium]
MATPSTKDDGRKVSEQLLDIRERWHCARHPFYDRLEEGTLDLKHLGTFLVHHSLLVKQIFRSIGVTYAKSPDDIAYFIVENLAEEAGMLGIDGGEAHDHRDLISAFTRYCGISDDELANTELLPTWYARAAYYWWITDADAPIIRIAVQSTQESQLVSENERVVPALCNKYGFTKDSPEIGFFVEHATADIKHGNILLDLVDKHATTPELRARCLKLAEQTCKLRWVSFNELYRVTHLGEEIGQAPA